MDREKYNQCMAPWMSGSKSKEERQQAMCIGAKICTGKAANEAEARQICLSQPPKPPKEPKKRRTKATCGQEMSELASCVTGSINMAILTAANFKVVLAETLLKCKCGEISKHEPEPVIPSGVPETS